MATEATRSLGLSPHSTSLPSVSQQCFARTRRIRLLSTSCATIRGLDAPSGRPTRVVRALALPSLFFLGTVEAGPSRRRHRVRRHGEQRRGAKRAGGACGRVSVRRPKRPAAARRRGLCLEQEAARFPESRMLRRHDKDCRFGRECEGWDRHRRALRRRAPEQRTHPPDTRRRQK